MNASLGSRWGRLRIARLQVAIQLPDLRLELRAPRVHIDDREARADIGLRSIGQIGRELASRGHGVALAAIAQTAREGDRLARIELGGNPIAEFARQRGVRDAQLNIDYVPKHRVRVHAEPGQVSLHVVPGKVHISGSIHLAAGRFIDVKV